MTLETVNLNIGVKEEIEDAFSYKGCVSLCMCLNRARLQHTPTYKTRVCGGQDKQGKTESMEMVEHVISFDKLTLQDGWMDRWMRE